MALRPTGSPAPSLPLDAVAMRRWGVVYDARQDMLSLAPMVPEGKVESTIGPFRAGRTVVALTLRRTPSAVTLRVTISFGPPLRVEVRLADTSWDVPAVVDEIPLGRHAAAFEATGTHEVIWRQ